MMLNGLNKILIIKRAGIQARGVLVGQKIEYDSGVIELHILKIRENFRNLTEIRWQEGRGIKG